MKKLAEEHKEWGLSIIMKETEYLIAEGVKRDSVLEQGITKDVNSLKCY